MPRPEQCRVQFVTHHTHLTENMLYEDLHDNWMRMHPSTLSTPDQIYTDTLSVANLTTLNFTTTIPLYRFYSPYLFAILVT
jgi:hypothetical protein